MQSRIGDWDKGLGREVAPQEASGESLNDNRNEDAQTENEGNSVNKGEPIQLAH